MANHLRILLIGGSGFVSGTLAQTATALGHEVWAVTRGLRPLPAGVMGLTADRSDRDAFARAIDAVPGEWDLVVDCIGYEPADAEQDARVFRDRAAHFVFVSTDFVFDPAHRSFPQGVESEYYLSEGYGGKKRACERILESADLGDTRWTIVRPCHIFGPGSLLGCLPRHGRDPDLLDRIRRGETLRLVGGGHFLQQPVLARDLAELILSCPANERTYEQIFCTAGPDIIESCSYYDEIAHVLGVDPAPIEEISVRAHLEAHPGDAPFLCHRIYDLERLRTARLTIPSTPFKLGIREHVESLI
ncbi:MAG: NAD-dependent epimerase/dehydratase family protein [Trueperaceae bacterium]|nr:MAG: NAD-dependent epimerase/dehydratase family protein [Trueperaceae bacterium]